MMHPDDQLLQRIALTLIPEIGPVLARNLISYCGTVEEVFRQKKKLLLKIPGIGKRTAARLSTHDTFQKAEDELAFIHKHKISVLFYTDEAYPSRLTHCHDAPILLYFKGIADLNRKRIVAVVGTRRNTEYGQLVTEKFVEELKAFDVMVVSGLAYGIDYIAHRASLAHEVQTVGVVAHGLDRMYPQGHGTVAKKMLLNGGLVTEYCSGTTPGRENFPSRNRIVAGLSDAVVVIEAAERGGALITADIAMSYSRDVFAIPGRVDDPFSAGCNSFIRENKAGLITCARDLAVAMSWDADQSAVKTVQQRSLFIDLDPDEKNLLERMEGIDKMDVDTLAYKAGLPISKVSVLLLQLEFKGAVKSFPGKVYAVL